MQSELTQLILHCIFSSHICLNISRYYGVAQKGTLIVSKQALKQQKLNIQVEIKNNQIKTPQLTPACTDPLASTGTSS